MILPMKIRRTIAKVFRVLFASYADKYRSKTWYLGMEGKHLSEFTTEQLILRRLAGWGGWAGSNFGDTVDREIAAELKRRK